MEDIKKLYVDELRDLARARGVPGASGMKKAELIAALSGLSEPDHREVLFRQFPPGSEPVSDGRPESRAGYSPESDPMAGEPDPKPAAKTREKVGDPIAPHRNPVQIFADMAADIDQKMTREEKQALETLRAAGWQVMIRPQIDNAYLDRAVRAYRIRGRYDIALVRQKIRR